MTIEIFAPQNSTPGRWLSALLLGCAVFVLTLFCLELIVVSVKISPLWFPTTFMTIVVFRCPLRQLPLLLTACVLGTAAANAIVIGPALSNIKFALLNLVQAGVGGMLLRALLDRRAPLNSLHDWARLVLSVGIVTPLLGGLMALWMLRVSGHASFPFFYTWVISEIIGMLVLGPMLLLMPWPLRRAHFSDLRPAECVLTLLITLGASYLALRFMPWPFTFIVVILFWCAVRLPKLQAFVLFFLNASFIALLLACNLVSVVNNNTALGPVSSWLPFLLVLIPSHIMSLVMDAFRREKLHITDSETRFRHAMEYSAIGMALVAPEGNWLQVNRSLCQILGYPAEELKRLTFQQITHPDDLALDLQQVNQLLEGEIDTYTFEKRYFRKDGEIVWARLTVSLVRDGDTAPLYFIAQIIDISELKKSEQVNRRLMERITLANEAGGIGVWEWNLLTGEMLWDKRMYALFGLAPHESPSYDLWLHLLHTADREYAALTVQQAIELRSAFHMEYRIVDAQGQRWIRTQANRQLSKEGRIERMLGICQDITPLRDLNEALFQEKERMAITLDSIGEAVISTDEAMRVAFMNPVAEKMSGWSQEQAAGKPLSELLHITQGQTGPEVENLLLCQLPPEKITPDLDEDLVLHTPDGGHIDIHYSITPLRSEAGLEQGAVMVIQDVSESRKLMKRLSYSALHDTLTRLPNRASFELQLKRLLFDAAEHHHQHVLVFIDLDKFKAVNDSAGHAAGDALLRELSELMQHHLRSSDFLARLGGDEFALLMADCQVDQARDVVQRIVAAVNDYRFQWQERRYQVGASAGVTQISADNCVSGDVLSQADIACYNAKRSGRGRLVVFEQHRLPLPGNPQGVDAAMIDALQIELPAWAVAPPKTPQSAFIWLLEVQLLTPEGILVDETLLRHNLPDETLRRRLDSNIIEAFFRQDVGTLNNKGIPVILPLSEELLGDAAFVQQLCQRFVAAGLASSRCGFAFPAASVLSKSDRLYTALLQLRECGCRIALHHFGRNLDAFNLLSDEVVDYLVLAPELVANAHTSLMDEMLLTIIQGQATQRHISVLAGPVSVPAVLSTLADLDVDGVWGSAVTERQPLRSLAEDRLFAIR
ncbi:diguanylate cyclase [Pantoea anthophila]|uniref:diguanylate cyclase n=1 Tax=Pantoea anthophila TaxID=470931 RepID=UPI003018BED9